MFSSSSLCQPKQTIQYVVMVPPSTHQMYSLILILKYAPLDANIDIFKSHPKCLDFYYKQTRKCEIAQETACMWFLVKVYPVIRFFFFSFSVKSFSFISYILYLSKIISSGVESSETVHSSHCINISQ